MRCFLGALTLAMISFSTVIGAATPGTQTKPTIILVHGAFAESSSWNGVVARLERDGFSVIAAANPLRGVQSDAASVSSLVGTIHGPVILVGHSYGGPVITEAAQGKANVTALVYVAGFMPLPGESSLSLSKQFPGSTLANSLRPVALADGDEDLFIDPVKFRAQFAADVAAGKAALMAASQRPVLLSALAEPSRTASWQSLPTYVIYGSADRNISAAAMEFMAYRANARRTVRIDGASHAVMVSHPAEVAALIEEAASSR
jgi:pimeloyl-ACP methyl ester carboxylesterase